MPTPLAGFGRWSEPGKVGSGVGSGCGPVLPRSLSEAELLGPPYQPSTHLSLGSWTPSQMKHLSCHILLQGSPLTRETVLTTLFIRPSGK